MAINLEKGQKINLKKDNGSMLQNICVGVNWGAIEKKGWFGGTSKEAVDLDASCVLYDSSKNAIDVIYFGSLISKDGSIKHSGDDLTGDMDGDDGLDNEIITVDLNKVNPVVDKIFFFINIYLNQGQSHDFSQIPYAKIRMYEGTSSRVTKVHSSFDIATDRTYANKRALIMAKLYKRNNEWKFDAIGEPTEDKIFLETIQTILKNFAK